MALLILLYRFGLALGLCLLQTMLGEVPHFGVFCSGFIAKGVRFGPFQGKMVNTSEVKTHMDNSVMWEVSVGDTGVCPGLLVLSVRGKAAGVPF